MQMNLLQIISPDQLLFISVWIDSLGLILTDSGNNVVTIYPSTGTQTTCPKDGFVIYLFFAEYRVHGHARRGQDRGAWVAQLCQTLLSGGLWLAGFRLCAASALPFGPNGH